MLNSRFGTVAALERKEFSVLINLKSSEKMEIEYVCSTHLL